MTWVLLWAIITHKGLENKIKNAGRLVKYNQRENVLSNPDQEIYNHNQKASHSWKLSVNDAMKLSSLQRSNL